MKIYEGKMKIQKIEGSITRTNIPKTDSIQELAHFWDMHDLTDFEGELEEVNEPVFKRQTSVTFRS